MIDPGMGVPDPRMPDWVWWVLYIPIWIEDAADFSASRDSAAAAVEKLDVLLRQPNRD